LMLPGSVTLTNLASSCRVGSLLNPGRQFLVADFGPGSGMAREWPRHESFTLGIY
jgi:hypothetical protein